MTQYANVPNRTIEVNDIAHNKLTMPDSYISGDLHWEQASRLQRQAGNVASHPVTADPCGPQLLGNQ
jgi:hypothetical protein